MGSLGAWHTTWSLTPLMTHVTLARVTREVFLDSQAHRARFISAWSQIGGSDTFLPLPVPLNCLGLSNHTYFQEETKQFSSRLIFKKRTAEVNKLERKPGEMFRLISCHVREEKLGRDREVWP